MRGRSGALPPADVPSRAGGFPPCLCHQPSDCSQCLSSSRDRPRLCGCRLASRVALAALSHSRRFHEFSKFILAARIVPRPGSRWGTLEADHASRVPESGSPLSLQSSIFSPKLAFYSVIQSPYIKSRARRGFVQEARTRKAAMACGEAIGCAGLSGTGFFLFCTKPIAVPAFQAMDTQLNALPILPVRARIVSGCLNSAFSRHFSTFYGSSVQAMDAQLDARHQRRTPTIHQGRAQRIIEVLLNEQSLPAHQIRSER